MTLNNTDMAVATKPGRMPPSNAAETTESMNKGENCDLSMGKSERVMAKLARGNISAEA
jgi:hypothetical protein